MATTTNEDLSRAASGRLIRNLALSISGGAILTLLGASAAHADDLSDAGTASDGAGAAHSGDATAVGNQSGSTTTQSGSPSGSLGNLQVVNQRGAIANTGVAVANTGGNVAVGNQSTNGATGTQIAGGGLGAASNSGTAGNASNGSASVSTGDATAIGNKSTTTLTQGTTAAGALGGILIVDQNALVTNSGAALANTGRNTAIGNDADSTTGLIQTASAGQGLAANDGKATNSSNGKATIATGNAWAVGNSSDSSVTQAANGSAGGALGGLVIIPQDAVVVNAGLARANTGRNEANGNTSENFANVQQEANAASGNFAAGTETVLAAGTLASNSASADSTSDGSASIATGSAHAAGNESSTTIGQDIDPSGLVIPLQVAAVANVGVGIANSGDNDATGNDSLNAAGVGGPTQEASVGSGNLAGNLNVLAGLMSASNSADASNTSDGTASISTGDATATGNHSATAVSQSSTGAIDGLGLVLNTQAAVVANAGLGVATTGDNTAVGNESDNGAGVLQRARVASDNTAALGTFVAGQMIASNAGTASNTSDGTASIVTGDADATGNSSTTDLAQDESADISGFGAVINTQVAVVANVGAGLANSGDNSATGNTSASRSGANQTADVASDNLVALGTDLAGQMVASNAAEASNTSDGDATVATGAAHAAGNTSSTDVDQTTGGSIDGLGLVVDTQVGGVLNAGVGIANSGRNTAIGNEADNTTPGPAGSLQPGAAVRQDARIASGNIAALQTGLAGGMVAANQGTAANTSDGTAAIHTGAAHAQGNVSATHLGQDPDTSIDGLGAAVDTQVAGVANVGLGIANSGRNEAVGNSSENDSDAVGTALISSGNLAPALTFVDLGTTVASNAGGSSNDSDGSAKVGTGAADATGNRSTTTVVQREHSGVTGSGLILGTQVAGVANVGLAVANSGRNVAIGNQSLNDVTATQTSNIARDTTPAAIVAVGPVVASNSGHADNSSDGEACVCTGDATASGNESTTTLAQDLDLSTGGGLVVLTEAGGVLNAGAGIANSGRNRAVGNESTNAAFATQTNTINDALIGLPIVGPQIASTSGGASNTSDGAGKVGSGKATATGNQSTTTFAQAATVDSALAVSTLSGGTANAGLGLANSGRNEGIGNNSVNRAVLTQTADGGGLVSSSGEATNESDGTATIGDPNCDVPGESTPGTPGLPRTGGPLEAEAAIALMLLLVGFGLRRKGQHLA